MNKNPAVATWRGFFMAAGFCAAWCVVRLSLVFGRYAIVDFSAVEIADCNCKAGITTPR
jgi:hypothetical protein